MTYKFNDKSNEKVILSLLSIATIGAILSVFVFNNLIISIIAFLVSAFDFYCTRSISRKNKSRIKDLSIVDLKIRFSFFYKRKVALAFNKSDCTIAVNERQIIFSHIDESIILGIANKEDMEEPEKWDNLISDLTT